MNEATNRNIARAVSAWLTAAIVAAAAFALAGCQNDTETTPPLIFPQEQAQTRTETITLNINGNEIPVNITATLLRAEMDLVKGKLKTALNIARTQDPSRFDVVINRNLTIIVESGYTYFKVYSGNKLGINLGYISDSYEFADDLGGTIVGTMHNNQNLGKAITPSHDSNWQQITGDAVRLTNAATKRGIGGAS
jgi:hypothetical protein